MYSTIGSERAASPTSYILPSVDFCTYVLKQTLCLYGQLEFEQLRDKTVIVLRFRTGNFDCVNYLTNAGSSRIYFTVRHLLARKSKSFRKLISRNHYAALLPGYCLQN